MSRDKVAVLPDSDEMMRRLMGVSSEKHLVESLYPLICSYAGREMVGDGIATMLVTALHDYGSDLGPELRTVLLMLLKPFARALIDDREVLEEALRFIDNLGRK